MKLTYFLFGLIFSVLLFATPAADAGKPNHEAIQKAANELFDLIMCPICAGQTIAQSTAETSAQMRGLILKKLNQGESKEEILQYFSDKYGERILAMPRKKGLNVMLWFLPFIIVALVAVSIYFLIGRWSKGNEGKGGFPIPEERLTEYEERMEKELKDFDS